MDDDLVDVAADLMESENSVEEWVTLVSFKILFWEGRWSILSTTFFFLHCECWYQSNQGGAREIYHSKGDWNSELGRC